jgi:hypothetical protein
MVRKYVGFTRNPPDYLDLWIEGDMKIKLGSVEGWVVTHDGETVKSGFANDGEAMKWLHNRHSYSVDHAVEHEGYDIVLVRGGKVEWSYKRDILGKKSKQNDFDPKKVAEAFEADVRRAFVKVYGPPNDLSILQRSIRSSYLPSGEKLGWTDADPNVVLVLTEFAWVQDPYRSEEDHDDWESVEALLRSQGWTNAGWDSINPGVQVVFFKS